MIHYMKTPHEKHLVFDRTHLQNHAINLPLAEIKITHIKCPMEKYYMADTVVFKESDGRYIQIKNRRGAHTEDSESGRITMKTITKYQPTIPTPPARDLEEAKRLVLQISEAFIANFQNTETDLAHMITDKFMLRESNTKEPRQ